MCSRPCLRAVQDSQFSLKHGALKRGEQYLELFTQNYERLRSCGNRLVTTVFANTIRRLSILIELLILWYHSLAILWARNQFNGNRQGPGSLRTFGQVWDGSTSLAEVKFWLIWGFEPVSSQRFIIRNYQNKTLSISWYIIFISSLMTHSILTMFKQEYNLKVSFNNSFRRKFILPRNFG